MEPITLTDVLLLALSIVSVLCSFAINMLNKYIEKIIEKIEKLEERVDDLKQK